MKTSLKLAHVHQETLEAHLLKEHLLEVDSLASRFAESFGNADWAEMIGRWHDLGKYSDSFQNMIAAKSGYDPEAHLEGNSGKPDHSTAGSELG